MNIKNTIAKWIIGDYSYIGRDNGKSYLVDFNETRQPFAQLIFLNVIELLTDLANDVTLVLQNGNQMLFAEFNLFFQFQAQFVLNRIFNKGFAVISYGVDGFKMLDEDEYTINNKTQAISINKKNVEFYVMKSDSFRNEGKSDRMLCNGFLEYLDNILNASNTTTARLGNLIMASPQNGSAVPVLANITDAQKKEIEKEISEDYGSLKSQKQILIWKNAMNFTQINLSGMDRHTIEKAKFVTSVICDRIKVPANQVSIFDASNSNGLSNGGEITEGDILKYKTFERLLNKTFIRFANDLDMKVNYTIYNKPKMNTQTEQSTL